MKNYIEYELYGEIEIKKFPDNASMDGVFREAANMIRFFDCTDIEIERIVFNNEEYEYAGWQPDMLFEFKNRNGSIVWSRYFPNWEH